MTPPSRPRLRGHPRAFALELAACTRADWAYATEVIARGFRTHREIGGHDRRRISETVYGLIRWDRLLSSIVRHLAERGRGKPRRLSPAEEDELLLLTYEARHGVLPEQAAGEMAAILGAPVPPDLLVGPEAGLGNTRGLDREALRRSFPTWLYERLVTDFGETEAAALADALNERAPLCVRCNTVRLVDTPHANAESASSGGEGRRVLIARLRDEGVVAHPTELSSAGLVFETRVNAFGLAAFRQGLFEVMDEGSQLVAEVVAPPPRGRVVDACAGAGGKTLALAALLSGQGRVLALDVSGKKLEELRRRARRAGLSTVAARPITPGQPLPAEAKPGHWDRVLVDAPCSGIGTLRRNPEARWRLTPAEVATFPARQLSLLVDYAPLVAVGGRLVYATCTLLAEENQRVIERFLAERREFELFPVKEIWGKERALVVGDGSTLQLRPNRHGTDGFFAAVLRRVR